MRKLLFLMVLTTHIPAFSQIHELGAFAGAGNFVGDVGSTRYIAPKELAVGGVYRWNRSPRHSYRLSLIYSTLKAQDSSSDDPRRVERAYAFSNKIIEVALGMEFTFKDFNLHQFNRQFSPYLYFGIAAISYEQFYFDDTSTTSIDTQSRDLSFGIPISVGLKANILPKFVLGFELGARYTFTDHLDGSNPKEAAHAQRAFGNVNNNDWYFFSGMTLTYTFIRKPCYCSF